MFISYRNPIDGSYDVVINLAPLAGDTITSSPQVVEASHPSLLKPAAYDTTRYDNVPGIRTARILPCRGMFSNKVVGMLKDSKALLLPVLEAVSKTDPSINPDKIKAVIQLLDDEASSNPMDDVYSRSKVAATLNMSMKAVDYHCRKGDFKRVYLGNSSRAIGISRRSIEEAMTVR